MVKTSNNKPAIPIILVTGLLGSGKTTCIKHLLSQKPENETWGILVNEFGEISVESAQLNEEKAFVTEVSGGCICCTAHLSLIKGVNQLLSEDIDKLIIEPTGLGHPAKVIDTLQKTHFAKPISLQHTLTIVTADKFQHWKKSAVLRDLVTLADTLLINKTDIISNAFIEQANDILHRLYPAKKHILYTQNAQISLEALKPIKKLGFTILSQAGEHLHQIDPIPFNSQLPQVETCHHQSTENHQAIGWQFASNVVFNRSKLKQLLPKLGHHFIRGKGVLRTGNEWQLFNYADQQINLSDLAWRQDSRLELIFACNALSEKDIAELERTLNEIIFIKN